MTVSGHAGAVCRRGCGRRKRGRGERERERERDAGFEWEVVAVHGVPFGYVETWSACRRETVSVAPTATSEIARPPAAPIAASPQSNPVVGATTRTMVAPEA